MGRAKRKRNEVIVIVTSNGKDFPECLHIYSFRQECLWVFSPAYRPIFDEVKVDSTPGLAYRQLQQLLQYCCRRTDRGTLDLSRKTTPPPQNATFLAGLIRSAEH